VFEEPHKGFEVIEKQHTKTTYENNILLDSPQCYSFFIHTKTIYP